MLNSSHQKEQQLKASVGYFDDQLPAKRRLVPIIDNSSAFLFFMRVEITSGVNEKQFVSWSTFLKSRKKTL